MPVKKSGSVRPQRVERAVKTKIKWLLGRHDGAPNF